MTDNEARTSRDSEKGDGRERCQNQRLLFQLTPPFLELGSLVLPSILQLSLYSSDLNLFCLSKFELGFSPCNQYSFKQ